MTIDGERDLPAAAAPAENADDLVRALRRPDPKLLRYYTLFSLITGPAFPVVFGVLFLRYRTLRYRFDDEGVTMSWGALFKREISLTYSRIQDIHLRSNRGRALARSFAPAGPDRERSAKAEMKVEGLLELSAVRNFMYSRMRGARAGAPATAAIAAAPSPGTAGDPAALAATLREIAHEVTAIREKLERRGLD